jgi:glucose-6-phosphate isomerase
LAGRESGGGIQEAGRRGERIDVDPGNALASVASPGVSEASLERLDERVAVAHERIERGRERGEFGYAVLNLPQETDASAIERAVAPLDGSESVLTVGRRERARRGDLHPL